MIRDFWESRAQLGIEAGTRDLIASELERRAISGYLKDDMSVLDVGCGAGITGIYLLQRHRIAWTGIDYAKAMIESADRHLETAEGFRGDWVTWQHDITDIETNENLIAMNGEQGFDLIYSQRCLINLPDWPTQQRAVENISNLLKPGGLYLMVESCQDGLDKINDLRRVLNLAVIQPPWHNRYLHIEEIHSLHRVDFRHINTYNFAGTYYFLSRIVNAALAKQDEREPDYDSPINQLALDLPTYITSMWGQTMMFIFQKV